ncbi:MAG: hypothetical protein WKF30_15065 [Pyrinomonadaceae bacterium]
MQFPHSALGKSHVLIKTMRVNKARIAPQVDFTFPGLPRMFSGELNQPASPTLPTQRTMDVKSLQFPGIGFQEDGYRCFDCSFFFNRPALASTRTKIVSGSQQVRFFILGVKRAAILGVHCSHQTEDARRLF